MGSRVYTKDGLIRQLLMLAEELGRAPTAKEFNEDARTANVSTIYRLFGSWKKFLKAAGLESNRKRPRYTEEGLIQQVLMLAEELGRTPTAKEFNEDARTVSNTMASKLFGSWKKSLEAAGLEVNRRWSKYTEEGLIQQALMLAEELGRTPTTTEFDEDTRTPNACTIYGFFGSWGEFLKAAGLEVNRKRPRYTEEELIRQVLMLAEELRRTPTVKEFHGDPRTASFSAVKGLFGSWKKFLKAAGLEISRRWSKYTEEGLIQQALMLAEELGRTPTSIEFNEDTRTPSVSTIYRFFGSWDEFLKAAGLEANLKRPRYKEEELIRQILMLVEELGRTPTSIEFNEDARTATRMTAYKFFGSWNKFLEAAGLEVNRKRPRYTEEELIQQVLMLAEELGRTPTSMEFDKDARTATCMTTNKFFGSWNKFLEAAGLEINRKQPRYTEEELIQQVLMLAEELGRTPTVKEFDEDTRTATCMTTNKFFGSWNKFLEAAGLKINHKWQRYTEEELIQQVLMLAEELGRTPTSIEFNEDTRTPSVSAIYRFFGSWGEFLKAAGLKSNPINRPQNTK